MSLREVSLQTVTGKQFIYKLKAYSNAIYGLILIQCLGLLFSYSGGVSSAFSSYGPLSIKVNVYAADVVIAFSLFWIFINALWLPFKQYKLWDFTLVSNRLSSNLSNIGVLLTFSLFAGMTASLMGYVLRLITYFNTNNSLIFGEGFRISGFDFLLGMAVTVLYMVLLAAVGYLIGVLTQVHSVLIFVVPAVVAGVVVGLFNPIHLGSIAKFFVAESVPLLFALKVLVSAGLLFAISILITNRMEVKR